jgi:hypothetical protein
LISKQNDNALYYFGENHAKKKKNRGEKIEKKKKKKEKKNGFLELYGSSTEITHRQIKKFPPR